MRLRDNQVIHILLCTAILLFYALVPFTQPAQAAGETFRWEDPNTILACNGTYSVCGTYKLKNSVVPGGPEIFFLDGNLSYQGCTLYPNAATDFRTARATYIQLNSDGRTGTAEFHQIDFTGNPGSLVGACPRGTDFPDISVTMANERGLQAKQPATFKLLTSDPNAPASIVGSVKKGHNQQVGSPAVDTKTAQRVASNPALNESSYTWEFLLDPGDYSFCFHSYTPGCSNFTVAGSPVAITFGETTVQRIVTIRAGTNMSGIFSAIIKSADGSREIARRQDGPNTIAQPRVQQVDIGNINAGNYQACLSNASAEICKPFEKKYGQAITVQVDNSGEGAADENAGPQLRCEASIFNPLTWLICPLVAAAQGAVNSLNSAIDSLLTIDTDPIFNQGTATGKAFRSAWTSFRNLALGLIVIAGLIMVISQAAGLELLDAYTIRKVLPRLVIATIFITLSWPVLEFLISLTNDVGNGVRSLIYTPFRDVGQGGITLDMGDQLGAALVGAPVIMALGLLALGSFVITAFFAVLIGFAVLFLREAVIMFLVLVSPLAIACSILPNTQKFWDFWKGTLISMLLVFPIISAFIAVCRVFAVVFYNA